MIFGFFFRRRSRKTFGLRAAAAAVGVVFASGYLLPAATIFGAPFPRQSSVRASNPCGHDGGASAPFVEASNFSRVKQKHRLFLLLMLVPTCSS